MPGVGVSVHYCEAAMNICNEVHCGICLRPVAEEMTEVFSHASHDPTPNFRYCTECLIAGTDLSATNVRKQVRTLGDSIVIAGSASRLRLHIHTDDPEHIFELAAGWGELLSTKADDMVVQARTLASTERDVAVVTDSGADIRRHWSGNWAYTSCRCVCCLVMKAISTRQVSVRPNLPS